MLKTHLTVKEASECIQVALRVVKDRPELRFGQALYNHVWEKYPSVASQHHGGVNDFFYWTDRVKVMYCFLTVWIE